MYMVQIVLGKITGELQSEFVKFAFKRYEKFTQNKNIKWANLFCMY